MPRPATLRQGGLSWSPPHHPLPDALYTDDPAEYSKYELGNRMGMTQTDANHWVLLVRHIVSVLGRRAAGAAHRKRAGTS